jgi:transmembrane sensor
MTPDYIQFLLDQWLSGKATVEEKNALMELLKTGAYARDIKNTLEDSLAKNQDGPSWNEERLDEMMQNIVSDKTASQNKQPAMIISWPKRIAAAAIIIMLLTSAAYLVLNRNSNVVAKEQVVVNQPAQDVNPGTSKAVLTLANGSVILLDSAATGNIAEQGAANIIKTAGGQIAYDVKDPQHMLAENVEYNVLATPRGGQYKLVLPDGSLVWLNAESSIRYPTVFAGSTRSVEVTGEVYLEVAKQKKAFLVGLSDGSSIQVLGTRFNVNAYKDESAIKTTLLQGSVKILTGSDSAIISPGEQAQVSLGNSRTIRILADADMDQVMAWKNGLISFRGLDIKRIMKLIERWYDMDVVFQGNLSERTFTGEAESTAKLSEILRILRLNDINFKVEGKRIIVSQ